MQGYDVRPTGPEDGEDPVREIVLANPMPVDAQYLGLDRNTEEGALVAMSASLNGAKPFHRLVAWALLAVFAVPMLLGTLQRIF